jgi:hypothetical protein
MAKKKEEELKDVGSNSNNGDESGAPGEQGGEQGSGAPSEASGGGETQSGGGSGESGGGTQEGGGGSKEGGDVEKANRRNDLLQSIRSKRTNGLDNASSNTSGTNSGNSQGNARELPSGNGRTKSDNGPTPRADRTTRRGGKQNSNGDLLPSEITQENDSARVKEKATGVNVKGADKIRALAEKATAIEAPKVKFSWDDKPLSNKEGEEVLPKIRALLEFIFRHMDKGISISNRNKAEAHVWSTIDNEDIDIIAGHLVEMGKASKIVATAVRRMTNSYRLLQIGLITLPKFIQTYQFYAANGGFALGLPGGGK